MTHIAMIKPDPTIDQVVARDQRCSDGGFPDRTVASAGSMFTLRT